MKFLRSLLVVAAVAAVASACNQQAPTKAEEAPTAALVPEGFEPCNTISFADVERVIGTRPTISANDVTGALSPGWATCTYSRKDGSPGPTMTVRVLQLPSGPQAARRHEEITADLPGVEAVANDADGALVWAGRSSLTVQYHRGWWLTRRTVEGATDAQTRQRLLDAPRWP